MEDPFGTKAIQPFAERPADGGCNAKRLLSQDMQALLRENATERAARLAASPCTDPTRREPIGRKIKD